MDIRSLRMFCHLATSLHFGQTSTAMHVSAPTLSRTIQRLEEEVGEALFSRDNRRVQLTGAGQRFLLFAQRVLHDWRDLESQLSQDQDALTGQLHIYCSVTASYSFLYDLLMHFRNQHPAVDIKLSTGDPADALDWVKNNDADVVITARPDRLSSGLVFHKLGDAPLQMVGPVVPCQVSQQIATDLIKWESLPYILPERGVSRQRIEKWSKELGFKPNVHAEVSGHEAIVSMVALGLGVGPVPAPVLRNSPLRNSIRVLELPHVLGPFEVGICSAKRSLQDPKVAAFWAVAKSQS
ncbi:HTH-type transcriptional activator IlvY [Echinimonas agarilytica]|uniref:HTH-type transcriptional activator IlvY n=1 Tax=Echinimonas agarilytica TaxID=1215918 RepID=A0AA41W3L4_9GAMM|nr:HTH-type transcriptional activator IlvY [Echinimonas agarilytica]MCM2678166.1 HTH-type transcriptional activator IlvY [Echinimonas agarilytica]